MRYKSKQNMRRRSDNKWNFEQGINHFTPRRKVRLTWYKEKKKKQKLREVKVVF